jgi:hypothetical protein
MITFDQLAQESLNHRETADCTVKALAVVREIPYHEAHAICKQFGRKPRAGMSQRKINTMLKAEDNAEPLPHHELDRLRQSIGVRHLTPNNIGKALQRCGYATWNFYATTCNHAIGIRKGQVVDWTEGRRHRITCLIPVRPVKQEQLVISPTAPKGFRKLRHKKAARLGLDPKTGLPLNN